MRSKIFTILGVLFILTGLGIGGYIVYQSFFSGSEDAEKQISILEDITLPPLPQTDMNGVEAFIPQGEVFAKMYVPAWGDTWVRPVLQGTTDSDLWNGVGHYESTVLPGMVGNFAVASHRTVSGANFRDIHNLKKGDKIYFQTEAGFYEYTYSNSIIVKPSESGVLAPRPLQIDAGEDYDKFLTMTTCDPIWGDSDRFIGYGVYTRFYSNNNPPADVIRIDNAING